MEGNNEQAYLRALNRVTKWRSVLAGWQLGTRSDTDPECLAVRDHREATITQRVELAAVTNLLIQKGIITQEEVQDAMIVECQELERAYEKEFPGIRATDIGMEFDVRVAAKTMKDWKP